MILIKKPFIDLTKGNVNAHLLRMLGPASLAMIAMLSVDFVDAIYLGQLKDPNRPSLGIMAIAAIGFSFPITFIGNSFNIGLGAGTLSAISREIGQNNIERARWHGVAAYILGLCVMTTLVTLIILILPTILTMMGAKGHTYDMTMTYLYISLPGLVISSVAIMSVNILRANGEAALPSIFLITSAVINLILDPLLIFGIGPFPRLEIQGAAIASVVSNLTGAIVGVHFVAFHRNVISLSKIKWKSIWMAWKVVSAVGIPAACTNFILSVGAILAISIISRMLTLEDVAAFTIVGRIEVFSVGILYALSGCTAAMTGQNGGAGQAKRVRATFKFSYLICCLWGTFIAAIFAIFASQISGLFSTNSEVISKCIDYLYIVPITLFGYGFVFVSGAGLNALGRPRYGLVYTIIRSLFLYLSFIYLGVLMDGLRGAFIGMAIANLISGIIAAGWSMKRVPMIAKLSSFESFHC